MEYDAIVVGAGPNGLAAAIMLASHDLSVLVVEEKSTIGGGCKSEQLTLPGYIHDTCSSIYPLGIGSPFFRTLPLEKYGLEWIHPNVPLAHPFDDGTCALLERSIKKTAEALGQDAGSYQKLFTPFLDNWDQLEKDVLGPLTFPKHPWLFLQFSLKAFRSAEGLTNNLFKNPKSRALFAGLAAHSMLPLNRQISAAAGLVLGILGHRYGWPMAKGGAQSITDALAAHLKALGGNIQTDFKVASLKELPSARAILLDLTPRQIVRIADDALSASYKSRLLKYRYGPGVFKMDFALSDPIPWNSKECLQAGTVHLGGSFEEIAMSEKAVWEKKHAEKPYVLLAQHTLFDQTRAPKGKHTAWAYCHVPHQSEKNMTEAIENQIERFAPGFKECILAKSTKNTSEMTQFNANYIGGDINGGVQDITQLFTRPTKQLAPYGTSNPRIFICSSSTPPGGGVHGMCGYHAAKTALNRIFKPGKEKIKI